MNKETYLCADMQLIEFDNVDVIATSRDVIQPTLGPNDTEIL